MSNMPTIICARCEKPVERAEMESRPDRNAYTFTVWCHGARDECLLPISWLQDAEVRRLPDGRAFVDVPLLPAAEMQEARH